MFDQNKCGADVSIKSTREFMSVEKDYFHCRSKCKTVGLTAFRFVEKESHQHCSNLVHSKPQCIRIKIVLDLYKMVLPSPNSQSLSFNTIELRKDQPHRFATSHNNNFSPVHLQLEVH